MNDYMFIIRGGDEYGTTLSPEELQQHMQKWQDWMGNLASQDQLIGGQPLTKGAKTLIGRKKKLIDRPLAEGKELIGGYIMAKANSLDEATEIAKGCPGFEWDCSVEIREISPM